MEPNNTKKIVTLSMVVLLVIVASGAAFYNYYYNRLGVTTAELVPSHKEKSGGVDMPPQKEVPTLPTNVNSTVTTSSSSSPVTLDFSAKIIGTWKEKKSPNSNDFDIFSQKNSKNIFTHYEKGKASEDLCRWNTHKDDNDLDLTVDIFCNENNPDVTKMQYSDQLVYDEKSDTLTYLGEGNESDGPPKIIYVRVK